MMHRSKKCARESSAKPMPPRTTSTPCGDDEQTSASEASVLLKLRISRLVEATRKKSVYDGPKEALPPPAKPRPRGNSRLAAYAEAKKKEELRQRVAAQRAAATPTPASQAAPLPAAQPAPLVPLVISPPRNDAEKSALWERKLLATDWSDPTLSAKPWAGSRRR